MKNGYLIPKVFHAANPYFKSPSLNTPALQSAQELDSGSCRAPYQLWVLEQVNLLLLQISNRNNSASSHFKNYMKRCTEAP